MTSVRRTTAQALIAFLAAQQVERDGATAPLFAGVLGIFGHGNVAGVGQALQQHGGLRYVQPRNEQAMVHTAVAYAKPPQPPADAGRAPPRSAPAPPTWSPARPWPRSTACRCCCCRATCSPRGASNPVLQQLELPGAPDASVNDAFRPVSRFFDRINRPEQLLTSLPEAMRVLTDPAETGAVTLALPQDVQAEAYDYPAELFARRSVADRAAGTRPGRGARRAAELVRGARRPLIVAGGGVIYAEATAALRAFADATGIPVAETQAGKGSLPYDHPGALGAVGATGTRAANLVARDADLVIAIGTRLGDFTTASRTAFQDPGRALRGASTSPRFDAAKARRAAARRRCPRGHRGAHRRRSPATGVEPDHAERAARLAREWDAEVERLYIGEPRPRRPGRR